MVNKRVKNTKDRTEGQEDRIIKKETNKKAKDTKDKIEDKTIKNRVKNKKTTTKNNTIIIQITKKDKAIISINKDSIIINPIIDKKNMSNIKIVNKEERRIDR